MKQKLPFILEIIWLIVMVVGLAAAIHKTTDSGFSDSIMLYVIAGIAGLMYVWRRYMRKLQEKNQAQK
jgi:positive regulator of sigma E activity